MRSREDYEYLLHHYGKDSNEHKQLIKELLDDRDKVAKALAKKTRHVEHETARRLDEGATNDQVIDSLIEENEMLHLKLKMSAGGTALLNMQAAIHEQRGRAKDLWQALHLARERIKAQQSQIGRKDQEWHMRHYRETLREIDLVLEREDATQRVEERDYILELRRELEAMTQKWIESENLYAKKCTEVETLKEYKWKYEDLCR